MISLQGHDAHVHVPLAAVPFHDMTMNVFFLELLLVRNHGVGHADLQLPHAA